MKDYLLLGGIYVKVKRLYGIFKGIGCSLNNISEFLQCGVNDNLRLKGWTLLITCIIRITNLDGTQRGYEDHSQTVLKLINIYLIIYKVLSYISCLNNASFLFYTKLSLVRDRVHPASHNIWKQIHMNLFPILLQIKIIFFASLWKRKITTV